MKEKSIKSLKRKNRKQENLKKFIFYISYFCFIQATKKKTFNKHKIYKEINEIKRINAGATVFSHFGHRIIFLIILYKYDWSRRKNRKSSHIHVKEMVGNHHNTVSMYDSGMEIEYIFGYQINIKNKMFKL